MTDKHGKKDQRHAESGVEIDPGLLFPVGRVVGFVGLAGSMKLRPSSNNPALLLDIKTVQVACADGSIKEAQVKEIHLHRRMLLLKLEGHADRNSVEQYVDCHISTTRQQLRDLDENEWWVDDLKGLEVFTTRGVLVGTISDIVGANAELLEITKIDSPGQEPVLVPFVQSLVPTVDLKAGRVEVVDLPGLLDPE